MKPIKYILIVLLGIASSCFANSAEDHQNKISALRALEVYSRHAACGANLIEKELHNLTKNVFEVERNDRAGTLTYFILWDGDLGCAGGSGTHSHIISEVYRRYSHGKFYIRNNDAFGRDIWKYVRSRFIQSVAQVDPHEFHIISYDWAYGDPLQYPSRRYKYTLQKRSYNWEVTEKERINENNLTVDTSVNFKNDPNTDSMNELLQVIIPNYHFKTAGKEVDVATILESAHYDEKIKTLTYIYTKTNLLKNVLEDFSDNRNKQKLARELMIKYNTSKVCENPVFEFLVKYLDLTVVHSFKEIMEVRVDAAACKTAQ